MTDSYLEWVVEDLKKLNRPFQLWNRRVVIKKEMNGVLQVSHDIKGQGGSFDYDLMTSIGNEFCRFIEKADKVGVGEIAANKLHIDALKLVIDQDLKGTGGKEGEKMLSGLQQICGKLLD
jgi:hypothetical protein